MASDEVAAPPGGDATLPTLRAGESNVTYMALADAFPALELRPGSFRGQEWAVVPAAALPAVVALLRDDPRLQYRQLVDVTAVDLLPRAPRWEVVYSFLSIPRNARYRLKVLLADGEEPTVPSVQSLYPSANWYEREIFDLMGIRFSDHPNLTRILLPDDWQGYPLRFDHPLGGEEVGFTS